MLITLLTTLMLSTVSFARNLTLAQQLQQRLINLGISNTYIGNLVEYLQKIRINEDQFNSINSKIDEAISLTNGSTDIINIDEEIKSKIKNLSFSILFENSVIILTISLISFGSIFWNKSTTSKVFNDNILLLLASKRVAVVTPFESLPKVSLNPNIDTDSEANFLILLFTSSSIILMVIIYYH